MIEPNKAVLAPPEDAGGGAVEVGGGGPGGGDGPGGAGGAGGAIGAGGGGAEVPCTVESGIEIVLSKDCKEFKN